MYAGQFRKIPNPGTGENGGGSAFSGAVCLRLPVKLREWVRQVLRKKSYLSQLIQIFRKPSEIASVIGLPRELQAYCEGSVRLMKADDAGVQTHAGMFCLIGGKISASAVNVELQKRGENRTLEELPISSAELQKCGPSSGKGTHGSICLTFQILLRSNRYSIFIALPMFP